MILRHVYSPSPWCGPSRRPAPCHGMNLGSLERTPSCQRGARMRLASTARLPAALSSLGPQQLHSPWTQASFLVRECDHIAFARRHLPIRPLPFAVFHT